MNDFFQGKWRRFQGTWNNQPRCKDLYAREALGTKVMNVEIPDQKLHCFMCRRPWPMQSEWKWSTWPAVGSRFSSFYLPLLSFALSCKLFPCFLKFFFIFVKSALPLTRSITDDGVWNGEMIVAWQRMKELWNLYPLPSNKSTTLSSG